MPALVGKLLTWAIGNKWTLAAAAVLMLLAMAAFKYQNWRIEKLTAENQTLALERNEVAAVNQAQAAVITELERERERRDKAILYRDEVIYELEAKLAAKRQEITRAEKADAEYRDWSPLPVPAFVHGLLGQGPAGVGAHGDNPPHAALGAAARLQGARLARPY